jgi:histidyl-tRNA synthetase
MLAGGRYDPLIAILGGPPTPGIGFGSGVERIINELKAQEVAVPQAEPLTAVVVSVGSEPRRRAFTLAAELRRRGLAVTLAPDRSFKAQMRYANQLSAKYAVIIGERELAAGEAGVKPLQTEAEQRQVGWEQVAGELAK